ncbi:ABC transporter permease subunit [Microbacterium soli]|uniref:ABC transmembrane type-1 domain-containing protein n=1 Tax=Microbacterium soli TaxID=446075 RepID=A0ABP7MYV6_9MICO
MTDRIDARVARAPGNGGAIGALALPAIVFLLVVYVVPLIMVLVTAFTDPTPGLQNIEAALSPTNLQTLLRTIEIAGAATLVAIAIGYPVAYVIAGAPPRLQAVMLVGVIAPWMTSVLIRTFGWQVLLGRIGPIPTALRWLGFDVQSLLQTWAGLLFGLVQIIAPLFILPLVAVMRQIDTSNTRAALTQGAGPAEAFWRVYLPQTRNGLQVGATLAFVVALGSFVIPDILGGQDATMTASVVNDLLNRQGERGPAAALALLLTVTIFLLIGLLRLVTAPGSRWIRARDGNYTPSPPRFGRLRWGPIIGLMRILDWTRLSSQRWILWGFVALVQLFLFVPQLVTIPISFSGTRTMVFPPEGFSLQWYEQFFTPDWLGAAGTTMIVAPVAAVLATVLGALAAIGVERSRTRGWRMLGVPLLLSPLIVPVVVVSVGFYITLINVGLYDTVIGLILVETTAAIPYAFVISQAAMQSLDPLYERAARSMGASMSRVMRKVILPIIAPSIIVALLFGFLTLFDEVVIPVFASGIDVTVLPKRVYEAIVVLSDPTVAVVGTLSIIVAAIVLVAALVFVSRSRTASLETITGGERGR